MNSFRPLVYLTVGEDATGVFCRDSGLVQGDLSLGTATARARRRPGHSPSGRPSRQNEKLTKRHNVGRHLCRCAWQASSTRASAYRIGMVGVRFIRG